MVIYSKQSVAAPTPLLLHSGLFLFYTRFYRTKAIQLFHNITLPTILLPLHPNNNARHAEFFAIERAIYHRHRRFQHPLALYIDHSIQRAVRRRNQEISDIPVAYSVR